MDFYCAYQANTASLAILSSATLGERWSVQLSKISLLKIRHTSLKTLFTTQKVCVNDNKKLKF